MRILHYCQHVLGMGHLFRSLEIARALHRHEVTLVTGGPPVSAALPPHIRHVQLPPLMMDSGFSGLHTVPCAAGELPPDLRQVQDMRRQMLLKTLHETRPHILLVELFPFGRRQFSFELVPLLESARSGAYGRMQIVCSVRDILVEKDNQARYEERVLSALNTWFDHVLVHTDPAVVRLEETFSRLPEVAADVHDTGYVTPLPAAHKAARLRRALRLQAQEPLIVASAGSGSVGAGLLQAAARASHILHRTVPHRLLVFTGPFMPPEHTASLRQAAAGAAHIRIRTFTRQFPAYLALAGLSVSLAGYNTTMNLLAARTSALVLPFDSNREQRMRSLRLERLGALRILQPDDLEPHKLAELMQAALARRPQKTGINLDGARTSARILESAARHASGSRTENSP